MNVAAWIEMPPPGIAALVGSRMNPLLVIAVAAIGLAILASVLARASRTRQQAPPAPGSEFQGRKTILSAAERSFLGVLEQSLPDGVGVVMKIRLGDVFVTRAGLSPSKRASAWNQINQKHVDFLLVRKTDLAPLAGIELDDRSHEAEDRKLRDAFVDELFRTCGLPLLHVKAQAKYAGSALRAQLATVLPNEFTEAPRKTERDPASLADETLRAVEQILDLLQESTRAASATVRETHAAEVQESVVALIAAVVLADGMIHPGEYEFLKRLAKNLETPEQCRAFVESSAQNWKRISLSTPKYFEAVLQYDRANGTRNSQAITEKLRRIVECAALADGHYADNELTVASKHLAQLEAVFRQATWIVAWDERNALPKVRLDTSFRRDQFANREVS